ncbi:unnamed protein product [Porites lobata]|uniref:Uncharacterized protein n=1 Tax=Porites lobata TaxID=104759 RepID=A0ABN8NTL6_9CNID|nr:unnamed protein product [Porites lobata]
MWNLLFSEYLKAKDCNGNQIRSDSIHNSRWVTTIADAMKRCEIEANLDGMVLESQDLNILSKYNILKNFVEGRSEDESVNEVGIGGHNEKESKSEDGDAELTKECERKSKDKVPVKTKRAADARDKGVRCKSTKVSKKK